MFFFSSRRRHTRLTCDWSSDVCSSDLDRVEDEPAPIRDRALTLLAGALRMREPSAREAEHDERRGRRNGERRERDLIAARSEERRVGKEGRSAWAPDHQTERHTDGAIQ